MITLIRRSLVLSALFLAACGGGGGSSGGGGGPAPVQVPTPAPSPSPSPSPTPTPTPVALTSAQVLKAAIAGQPDGQQARMVVDGDSVSEWAPDWGAPDRWPHHAATALGIRSVYINSRGGTGYIRHVPGDEYRNQLIDRLDALLASNPHLVVIAAGVNDCSVHEGAAVAPIPEIAAAAGTYIAELRRRAPEAVIVILGPFTDYNNPTYSEHSRQCRDAIFVEARKAPGVVTADISDWVTPENRSQIFAVEAFEDGQYRSGDPIHPTPEGHRIYGAKATALLRDVIEGL